MGETGVAGIELSLGNNNSARNVVSDSEVVNVLSSRMIGEDTDTTIENNTEDADAKDSTADATDENKDDTAEEETKEEPVSEYANVGISIAPTYVNVREKANTEIGRAHV